MLLNKWNFAVSAFVSNKTDWYELNAIQVSDAGTAATNGYYMVSVSLPDANQAHFPVIDGVTVADTVKPFLLPLDACKKIAKAIPSNSTIPILSTALVASSDENTTTIAVTDLDTPQIFKPQTGKGQFPNIAAVMPKATEKPVFEITLGADLLATLAKSASSFTDLDKEPLLLQFFGNDKAVLLTTARAETKQSWTALLMPIAITAKELIANATKKEKK